MGYRLCVTQAKNGVISHRNLVLAIKGCHMDRPCLFGRDIELDAARISASLRQLVAKYRDVKRDTALRDKLRAKAGHTVVD